MTATVESRKMADVVLATLTVRSEIETAELGKALAARINVGDILALEGSLGTGKTVLARGFIRSICGADTIVPSPTFTLVQIYEGPAFPIWHCDLYRLENPEDALELGLEEGFADAVTLIEWAERLGPALPERRLRIAFGEIAVDEARSITLMGDQSWSGRLSELMEKNGA